VTHQILPDLRPRDRAIGEHAELDTGLPTLVVNGDRDPFGVPAAAGPVELCLRPGDGHDLRRDPAGVGAAVVAWLAAHGWARAGTGSAHVAPGRAGKTGRPRPE